MQAVGARSRPHAVANRRSAVKKPAGPRPEKPDPAKKPARQRRQNPEPDAPQPRRMAEKRLHRKKAAGTPAVSEEDAQRLIHELHVHQIELEIRNELEIQNEELLQARDQAESTMEHYAQLFDFAPVGYLTIDRIGAILTANLTGACLLGMPRVKLAGRNIHFFLSPDDRPVFCNLLDRVLQDQGSASCEALMRNADKEPFNARIELAPAGTGDECLVALIDITAAKEAETALKESRRQLALANETLERRVIEAVGELRRKDQLLLSQSRLAVMGEMISNIAHQWRQPLNLVGLHVQRLGMLYGDVKCSRESFDDAVEEVMTLIMHMSRTIDDFRNFFKPDKERCEFNVRQAIEQAVHLVADSFKGTGITVTTRCDGTATINGYPNEFAQALLNILQNARDALMERMVPEGEIAIASSVEGGRSVVTIADNAGGIPEKDIDRIFEPYFSTKGLQGTGIGLYMTKNIIENSMGGRITVRNTGKGAEFRIEV